LWWNTLVEDDQIGTIVGHVGIEVYDLSKSKKFYETLLGSIGFKIIMETELGIGFSNANFQVWIAKSMEQRVKREAPTGDEFIVADHLAFLVPERKNVDIAEKKMGESGFRALFPCEEHPQFEPGYYAVSFCDPDNQVIEIYNRSNPKRFR
jgi:catechol-2,3-dioxygenase